MHETGAGLIGARIIQVMEDGHQDVQHVGALEHVEEELLVVLAELPEEDQQFLVEVDLWRGKNSKEEHELLSRI